MKKTFPNVNAAVSKDRGVMIIFPLINQLTVVTFFFLFLASPITCSSLYRNHDERKNIFVTRGVCTNYGKRIVRTENTHRVKVVRNFFASLTIL